ncbi:hypothetical protein [Kribbella sp. NPDC051620]|uniref:hypothetical protein n=1 Tax=Kribbella sp. NPDC051620 TaxID=3364120 RepID=UPI00378BC667
MRKTLIAASMAAVLLGSSLSPAVAATTAEVPTDVQVSWADVAKRWLRVTWTDQGQANFLAFEIERLPLNPTYWEVETDADGNNEAILKHPFTGEDKVRVTVRNNTPSETARAASVWFDTQKPAQPKVTGATPSADLSLRLSWTQAATPDLTPNDPLDRPVSDETLTASVGTDTYSLPLGTTTTTIPPHPRPWTVHLNAANEWGADQPKGSSIDFGTMTAGFRIDPLGIYGRTSLAFDVVAAAKACAGCAEDSGPNVVTYLQSRIDASRPWKTIGIYRGEGERFTRHVGSQGGLQYRIYIPASTEISNDRRIVTPAAATSARYSATQAYFVTAWFNKRAAQVGQVVKLVVDVRPAGTVKADLQVWDGKVWRHAGYVPLVNGKGTLNVKAAGRGTTRSWRVVVPKMSYYGKPILATAGRTFKLAVS